MGIDEFLTEARAALERVSPSEVWAEVERGAVLVDVRPVELRELHGPLPGALIIGLNVLEWRLAPSSPNRVIDVDPGRRVILVCNEGYSSSLAAFRLQRLGVTAATDVVGGFQGLLDLGLLDF
jgi:rhodanese-related sulfurtransferase